MKFLVQPLYNWYRSILRHPKYRWLVILGSFLYLFSPVDLITDMLPVVGWLDDGVIATLLVSEVSQMLLEQRNLRRVKDLSADANIATVSTTVSNSVG
ncbi:MAG: DUF1232 domain-containing protein [Drouetiella hepatica Uher 2000/2452]|jgi:uncharacterized membrane protein YkvA (DUF1232 family)|uniref:DUF1232 domain-containing protein n=1 Tax=Drouetiella hepatica Uher 2000/2452 TaxID=904376 RepID=A0A951Q8X1_9CYAN|nr:DUF1232 domain-containing protein [Drouetiella hepatica Uher 2000/2452]